MPGARVNFFNFGSSSQQQDDDDGYDEGGDVTVCKLQVGMYGDIKKWQERLNRTADSNRTDDEEGLHNVFRDAVMLVLRNIEYAGYCSSAGKVGRAPDLCPL